MESLLALTVGALVAAAAYLMLARSLLRFLFGLILLSNGANLLLFAAGRVTTTSGSGGPSPPSAAARAAGRSARPCRSEPMLVTLAPKPGPQTPS